jgi:hypothetical protein
MDPGILVLLVTIITMLLTGMAIVREREIGTLEQLMEEETSAVPVVENADSIKNTQKYFTDKKRIVVGSRIKGVIWPQGKLLEKEYHG